MQFTVAGPPVAWHRPENRRGGGRRRHPEDTWYQDHIAVIARAHVMAEKRRWPVDGECTVLLQFRVPDRRRRDIDNLEKNVLDALKGVIYIDDTQVHAVSKTKIVDAQNTGIDVMIVPGFVDVFAIVCDAIANAPAG